MFHAIKRSTVRSVVRDSSLARRCAQTKEESRVRALVVGRTLKPVRVIGVFYLTML